MALKRGLYIRRVDMPDGHYRLIDRHGAEHPKWGASFALVDVEAFVATLTVTNPSALPLWETLIEAGTRQQDAAPDVLLSDSDADLQPPPDAGTRQQDAAP